MIKIVITFLVAFAGVFSAYNFVPLKYFEFWKGEPMLGATITTINGSDTLSASRTVINTNFTNLNTDTSNLMATTSMSGVTTLSRLATIGTITSGTWSGTAIAVAKGGTGTTTFSSNQILLGDGSSGVKVVSGLGSDGQYLVSQGAGLPPNWESVSLDGTLDYNWTGASRFKNLHASSTVANPMYLNGIDYAFPSTEGASSTILATNGTGSLSWNEPDWVLLTSTTTANNMLEATSTIASGYSDLQVKIYIAGMSAAVSTGLRFNTDCASNYGGSQALSGATDTQYTNQTRMFIISGTTSPAYLVADIFAMDSKKKLVNGGVTFSCSATQNCSDSGQFSGVWNNTSDYITKVVLTNDSGATFTAGTVIKIYGRK